MFGSILLTVRGTSFTFIFPLSVPLTTSNCLSPSKICNYDWMTFRHSNFNLTTHREADQEEISGKTWTTGILQLFPNVGTTGQFYFKSRKISHKWSFGIKQVDNNWVKFPLSKDYTADQSLKCFNPLNALLEAAVISVLPLSMFNFLYNIPVMWQ